MDMGDSCGVDMRGFLDGGDGLDMTEGLFGSPPKEPRGNRSRDHLRTRTFITEYSVMGQITAGTQITANTHYTGLDTSSCSLNTTEHQFRDSWRNNFPGALTLTRQP